VGGLGFRPDFGSDMTIGTEMKPERAEGRTSAFVFLALAGCLWGTGFFFGKIAFREMTVSENVTFRLVTGSIALSPLLVSRWQRYRARDWGVILLASAAGVPLQFLVQFWGLKQTTVSHASLIVGVLPVLLAMSSAAFLRERLRGMEWGLLGLSAAGAALIALSNRTSAGGPQPSLKGDLLVLFSMFAAVAMILCSKRLMDRYDALQLTASMIVSGTIMLVIWTEMFSPLRFHFSREPGLRSRRRVCWRPRAHTYAGIGD
jgi:drug/metabolite transporter (DMT)-like permease